MSNSEKNFLDYNGLSHYDENIKEYIPITHGYYNDGNFYSDSSFTELITGEEKRLYVDLAENGLYEYKNNEYIPFSGGGGTTNYNNLSNKPQINSVELSGNKSLNDLGIAADNHTHSIDLAADSGTSELDLSANTKYKLSAGGESFVFTTPTDTNTWRGIQDNLTSSSNTTESLSAKQGYLLANGYARDSTKLTKTTYEYNNEIAFGSSGKLLIGKFPCYDSNVTITINATTSTTYHCTAVLATQNINTTGGGAFTWETYDDSSNTITPNLYAKYVSGSNVIEIYFSPSGWSKNLVHIQCVSLAAAPTNICENVSSIPSEATRQPTNTLRSKTASSGGTEVSLVTTGEKYTWNNKSNLAIGTTSSTAAAGNHTHTATIAADSGTSALDLAANTKYKLTAGGSTFIFKTPVDNNTTYESKAAASGGTAVSLVTTGEKYTWNNKSNLAIGTTASTAAAGNHTHGLSLATDTGTSSISLAANTKYKLTAGGSTYIFTTPPDNNTTYESKAAASGGTAVSLCTTGEKYTWNNKSNLAIGTTSSTAAAGNHTHTTSLATDSGTATVTLARNTTYKLTAGGTNVIFKTPASDNTDTKNTAGSTDTSSKIFLIGATSQAANPQTYSDNEVYATSGVLTTKSVQVGGTAATMQYNSTNKCIDFVFA